MVSLPTVKVIVGLIGLIFGAIGLYKEPVKLTSIGVVFASIAAIL